MKNRLIYRISLSLLIVLVSSASLAQQSTSRVAPSVEHLRKHVSYLASPHLEGRRTGTAGANDAAHYIAGEFSQIGLRPAFATIRNPRNRAEARSNYRQKFPYVAGVKLGDSNRLSFTRGSSVAANTLRMGEDWLPLSLSANGLVEKSPVVFVGYGLTVAELKYDDYSPANVNGKIALALSGTPDGDNPHGQFARFDNVRWKAIAARNAGARALIVIAKAEKLNEDPLSRLRYDHSGDAGLPVLVISQQAAQHLTSLTRTQLEQLGKSEKERTDTTLTITLLTDLVRQEVPAYNIIGILDGSDPALKNEAIVIGAHYDHLGLGGEGSLAQSEGEVHHGADDNASGVAGILELARVLSAQRPKPKRTIVFVAFSGEEEGLLGSNYYVNHPVVPLANTVAMINLDMIGRLKDRSLVIGGVGTAQEWSAMIDSANLMEGVAVNVSGSSAHATTVGGKQMPLVVGSNGQPVVSADMSKKFRLTLNEDGFGPSDHSSFYAKQIPVLFFWTGTHADYHKPTDTADKINYEDEARILAFVLRIINDINAKEKRPSYTLAKTNTTATRTGFRVYLGTIPTYTDSTDGLVLDGVREESPAAIAGLKAGDKIVKLAGLDIRNVYDYTHALGEMKAGQEYDVEVLRGSERLKLKITPAARR